MLPGHTPYLKFFGLNYHRSTLLFCGHVSSINSVWPNVKYNIAMHHSPNNDVHNYTPGGR